MQKKSLSTLGYLLKILNIKKIDLANAIYVDRTLVSKWANGSVKINSRYVNQIVNFLKNKDITKNTDALNTFIKKYAMSGDSIEKTLKLFLKDENWKDDKPDFVLSEVQNTFVHVSDQYSDRFYLLLKLLDEAINDNGKSEVVLFDNEQFAWISKNFLWHKKIRSKLKAVLMHGNKITLISCVSSNFSRNIFDDVVISMYEFSNFTEYYFSSKSLLMLQSYYILIGKYVVYSESISDTKSYVFQTNDKNDLLSAEYRFNNHIKNCTLNEQLITLKSLHNKLALFKNVVLNDDVTYVFSSTFSYSAMSLNLLKEILESNNISPEKIKLLLTFQNSFNDAMKRRAFLYRNLCYKEEVENMIQSELYYLNEISNVIGEKVYATNKQIKKFIKDIIEKLSEENYEIRVISKNLPSYTDEFKLMCKKNHYLIMSNKCIRFTEKLEIVNNMDKKMSYTWENYTEQKYRFKNDIIAWLYKLLE